MTIVSVYATFRDAEEAERVARIVVEEKLAACANILGPCRSIYRWQGAVEEADEVAAIFKTGEANAPHIARRIAELHSYELPAITVTAIGYAPRGFADWVHANTD